jgi:hypothetical protein
MMTLRWSVRLSAVRGGDARRVPGQRFAAGPVPVTAASAIK